MTAVNIAYFVSIWLVAWTLVVDRQSKLRTASNSALLAVVIMQVVTGDVEYNLLVVVAKWMAGGG